MEALVERLLAVLGRSQSLPEEAAIWLQAVLVHDFGKLFVPNQILRKPQSFSIQERRALFPSVIAPEEEDLALDDALGAKRSRQRVTVQRPGDSQQTWLFGKAALAAPGATRQWAEEASSREGYDVLVMAAVASLIRAAAVEAVDVDLALGLPLGVYAAQREKLRDAPKGQEAYVAVNDRVPIRLSFSSVLVLPQAIGAYYAAVLNPDGSMCSALLRRPTGVIDVGGRTTDYFVMQSGPGHSLPKRCLVPRVFRLSNLPEKAQAYHESALHLRDSPCIATVGKGVCPSHDG